MSDYKTRLAVLPRHCSWVQEGTDPTPPLLKSHATA